MNTNTAPLEISADHVVRADPIPNTQRETAYPAILTMSRNELCEANNVVVRRLNAARRMRNFGASYASDMAYYRAISLEWNTRCNYWERLKSEAGVKVVAKALKAESEFYLEVKEALMDEGKAEHVAANLINTEAKLLAEARRLGVI